VSGIPTTTSSSSAAVGTPATDTGSISVANEALFRHSRTASRLPTRPPSVDHGISDAFPSTLGRASTIPGADVEKGTPLAAALEYKLPPRTWYGRRKLRRARPASDHGDDDDDDVSDEKGGKGKANGRRKIALWAPIYNGLAAALALGSYRSRPILSNSLISHPPSQSSSGAASVRPSPRAITECN
jgi:hypothetical protein